MPARIKVAPELMSTAQHLYEETLTPIEEIAFRIGLSRTTFYRRVIEGKWVRRRYSSCEALIHGEQARGDSLIIALTQNEPARNSPQPSAFDSNGPIQEPLDAASMVSEKISHPEMSSKDISSEGEASAAECDAVFARVLRAARVQLDLIERMQKTLQLTEAAYPERTTRISASLNKMLREIAVIIKKHHVMPPDETDPDPIPRDIDEFRQALARRIEAFVEAERGGEGEADAGII